MGPIRGRFLAGLVALSAAPAGLGELLAQQPTSPPAAVQDTALARDSVALQDTALVQDTTAADTLPPPTFPSFAPAAPRPPSLTAVWALSDLLAEGALSLADVLENSPSMHPIRIGFLEGPQAEVFGGAGATSLRYQVDGYEIAPIEGGPLDLHLVPLVELQHLWLARAPGGYVLSSEAYRNEERDPYSRIEAGTGDHSTNVIRAFFSGRFAGGPLGFGFDRFDTDGQRPLGSAQRTVVWANYARQLPGGVWGQLELRNTSSDRDSFPAPDRTDWIVRLRRPLGRGWYADVVGGGASVKRPPASPAGGADGAEEERDFGAHQVALRAGRANEWARALGTVRLWDGDGVPRLESEGVVELGGGPAELQLSGRWEDWEEFSAASGLASVALRLPQGVRLFGEAEDGARGLFGGVPVAREFFTRVTGGAELSLGSWRFGGQSGRWRVDPSPTLGLPFDSAGAGLRGGTVTVAEGWMNGPLFRVFGGVLEGGFRLGARDQAAVFYWPEDWWRLDGTYRLEGVHGQLGIRLRALGGVRGPLLVPAGDAVGGGAVSTGDLNWLRLEAVVRIRDVHIYYNYEFFDSATLIGDVFGYELPPSRYHFGVKWEFWN